jgi:predicted MFS family arabinose efflux permease
MARPNWSGVWHIVFGWPATGGGFLTEGHAILGVTTDWRWTFFINVPVAIVAFIVIAIFCPALKHASAHPKIDYAGAALLTVALSAIVLAVDNTEMVFADLLESTGLALGALQGMLAAVAVVAVAGFVAVERRAKEPILPLEFFRHKNYVLAISIALLFGGAFLGSIIYLTQFNQQVFGASPTQSGLMILPLVAGLMTSSIGSGQLVAKTGRYKPQTIIGAILATIGMFSFVSLTPESSYLQEALLMVCVGLGFGVMMPVINLIVQSEFSVRQLGAATSSSQLFRGLGSTIGVAVFGGLLTSGIASHLYGLNSPYLEQIKQSPAAKQVGDINDPNSLVLLNSPDVKKQITDSAAAQLKDLPAPAKEKAIEKLQQEQDEFASQVTHAFADSLHRIFIVSGCIMLVAMVLIFMVKERDLNSAEPRVAA